MTIKDIISNYQGISLKDMDAVKLLNRIDTKYILSADLLPHILEQVKPYYRVLDIEDERIFSYNSLYYDTKDNRMYLAHHNGRLNRHKIRFREYVSSKLCFLEIKYKIKGTRTIKHRTMTDTIENSLSSDSIAYITKHTPFANLSLEPKIHTDFSRMTLVSNELTERVTIDLELMFRQNGESRDVGNVVIIELKRDGTAGVSNLIDVLNHYGVYPKGFSKYCIGRALLENDLKYNNFKERILTINKINDGKYYYRNFGKH
jgi:hypothetical protein